MEAFMIVLDNICIDKQIKGGKPVIRGTRVPVDLILGKLAGGMSYDEVMQEYEITKKDILSALEYASAYISTDEIRAVV
jgi:uncharacterized protein (DUF433 family)